MEKEQENRILAQAVAKDDARSIQGTSIGYAISLLMDYGNGRQVTISGTLPMTATQEQFDQELDKLRKATNRQQDFVILRDRRARHAAAKKMVQALDHIIKSYEDEAEKEMTRLSSNPSTKGHTAVKTQLENMRSQVANFKQMKNEERDRTQSEVEICENIIANIEAKLGKVDE